MPGGGRRMSFRGLADDRGLHIRASVAARPARPPSLCMATPMAERQADGERRKLERQRKSALLMPSTTLMRSVGLTIVMSQRGRTGTRKQRGLRVVPQRALSYFLVYKTSCVPQHAIIIIIIRN